MVKEIEKKREVSRNLGRTIRFYREKQGLSLAQLAEMSNISSSYLNRIELGERLSPGLPVIRNISNALGVPIGHLIEMSVPVDASYYTEDAMIPPFAEVIFENNFTVAGKTVEQETKEVLATMVEAIFSFTWDGDEKNEELYELLIMVDSLKEVI